jgi:hypothetical protein
MMLKPTPRYFGMWNAFEKPAESMGDHDLILQNPYYFNKSWNKDGNSRRYWHTFSVQIAEKRKRRPNVINSYFLEVYEPLSAK